MGPPSLLILDNLETLWEPEESRKETERFLALLADVSQLALIITMRGAERPANIRWTRPFLDPLRPLEQDAARQTFVDIVDEGYDNEDIDKILLLADNMPLAIDLIANLVDLEGMDDVLHRWEIERTALLSDGHDKGSNLDLSISLSLDSPRLRGVPHARDLMGLLSILPDGLSDVELLQTQFPIENIMGCKVTLLRTSLAYVDNQGRLKALVPIREYVQKADPPPKHLIRALYVHFKQLMELHEKYHGTVSGPSIVARITSNYTNIRNILSHRLKRPYGDSDLVDTLRSICDFDSFSLLSGHGHVSLMDEIPTRLPQPTDHSLEVHFVMRLLVGRRNHSISNASDLASEALSHFTYLEDADLKCKLYSTLAQYFRDPLNDIEKSVQFSQDGLSLAISTGNTRLQASFLGELAFINWRTGNYTAGQAYAHQSQRIAKICGDLSNEARALRMESMCRYAMGRYSDSTSLSKRARDLLVLCGLSGGQLDQSIMNSLAEVHRLKSEYVQARNIQTEILHNVSHERDPYHYAFALLNIAQIDVEIATPRHEVERNLDTAHSILDVMSHTMAGIWCNMIRAALLTREGDFLAAHTMFRSCLGSTRGRYSEVVAYCLEKLGDGRQWRGRMGNASASPSSSTWTVTFLAYSLKNKQQLEIFKALQFLGDVYLADDPQQTTSDNRDTARSLFTVALEGFTVMDVCRSRAECMLRLGDIERLDGSLDKAVAVWKAARPLFGLSSQTEQISRIDTRLGSAT
ncbi:hypothetical protein C8R43DRAFT_1028278 [Mycena crocata]|nr:hypothetical protein C8R43DRAFT_1028278 [Mycena crocata]